MEMNDNSKLLIYGSYFIELFCIFPNGVFEKSFSFPSFDDDDGDTTPIYILKINNQYLDILENSYIIPPVSLPMLCKPYICKILNMVVY